MKKILCPWCKCSENISKIGPPENSELEDGTKTILQVFKHEGCPSPSEMHKNDLPVRWTYIMNEDEV